MHKSCDNWELAFCIVAQPNQLKGITRQKPSASQWHVDDMGSALSHLSHMLVHVKIINLAWRVTIGKVFAGAEAAKFITNLRGWRANAVVSQASVASAHNTCWLCGNVAPSVQHILWDCPSPMMVHYWQVVGHVWTLRAKR